MAAASDSNKSLSEQLGKRKALQVTLVVIAALVLAGNFVLKSLGDASTPAEGAEGSALEALSQLDIGEWEDEDGYDRDEFGTAWKDVDHNSCDTRNDILARDLENLEYTEGDSCQISSGTLEDPYTGDEIDFERGPHSGDVQIDHIVALKNAWVTGAYAWDQEEREQIANDPLNLVASDGPANMGKGADDTSEWLPDNGSYRCEYVAAQVAVKIKYDLWVTQDEHDAMADVLTSCPSEPLPTGGL
ncbi:HNH endonuclease family protein [Myceligenerans indicum]|uniref:HNH endonuclease family protein n=1 Tax=Myceligenerans indicum TaxID=2593663 RepID=UPI0027DBFB03|nr:HNH endonuclease family protein [Myceligenerans indicum]